MGEMVRKMVEMVRKMVGMVFDPDENSQRTKYSHYTRLLFPPLDVSLSLSLSLSPLSVSLSLPSSSPSLFFVPSCSRSLFFFFTLYYILYPSISRFSYIARVDWLIYICCEEHFTPVMHGQFKIIIYKNINIYISDSGAWDGSNILSRLHCQHGFAENPIIPAWVTRDARPKPIWVEDFSAINRCGLPHALSMPEFHCAFLTV